MIENLAVIGKSLPKLDSAGKVTGETKYTIDLNLPGMLYGKILRSPYPHAIIKKIDTSEAERLEGVRAVIAAKDTPKIKFSFNQKFADKLMLCDDRVRYIGDEVAAVAAISEEIAEEALKLIKVEYEPLPAVFNPEEAMKQDAPKVHPPNSNITLELHKEFGDVEKAFKESDYIFEDRYETVKVPHCCIETHSCVAKYEQSGKLTIWVPTQAPHTQRNEIARILGISPSKVRIIKPPVGGGFGGRLVIDMKSPIAAILSKKTGRPVKITNTRTEEFETARTRYPYIVYIKTGVKKDGKILARHMKIICDNGAYNDKGLATVNMVGVCFTVLYNVPNIKYDAYVVYTNKQYGTAFRGFGNPQFHYATETQLDMIAEKLGIDPAKLRLINANKPGDVALSGAKVSSCGFSECVEKATLLSGWKNRVKKGNQNGKVKKGFGLAMMIHPCGGRHYGYNATDAFIKFSDDGMVTVVTPAVDVGQGAETVMGQIAAEVLGVKLDNIIIITGDTDIIPYDLGAFACRVTFVNGNAVKNAAEDAKKELFEVASEMLEIHPDDLTARDGRIYPRGSSEKGVEVSDVVKFSIDKRGKPISGRGKYIDHIAPQVAFDKGGGDVIPTFLFGCQVAEVEVDTETGIVNVVNITAAHDCGRALNPMAAEGQLEGACSQGIGFALTEELILKDGKSLNPNFLDYKIMTSMDAPGMKVELVEPYDPDGPFGAKGIGEPGLVPTAPAIANAIYNAIGVRVNKLPITAEKILAALKNKGN